MRKPDLRVNLGGVMMKNPVTVASGTFGYGPEYADLIDLNVLGAITVKGISLKPAEGNPLPRTHETTGGMMNAIGLQNPGVEYFKKVYLPFLRDYDVPVIVNIWGRSIEDYEGVAAAFSAEEGVAGLELNVSCPNIKEGGNLFGTDIKLFEQVVTAVRKQTALPLIIKLSPNVSDISVFARAAEDCGADAVSLINTLPALAVDVETRRPRIGNITGGLSGPAIHPVAVKLVWDAARSVKIPVLGMGGIQNATDALEFIITGATAVAVGTANFTDPTTAVRVIQGIEDYLVRHNLPDIDSLRGSLIAEKR